MNECNQQFKRGVVFLGSILDFKGCTLPSRLVALKPSNHREGLPWAKRFPSRLDRGAVERFTYRRCHHFQPDDFSLRISDPFYPFLGWQGSEKFLLICAWFLGCTPGMPVRYPFPKSFTFCLATLPGKWTTHFHCKSFLFQVDVIPNFRWFVS